jgi:hypothetical protein
MLSRYQHQCVGRDTGSNALGYPEAARRFSNISQTLRLSHAFSAKNFCTLPRSRNYLPGPASGWIKVKTAEWREANRERYKLFEKT